MRFFQSFILLFLAIFLSACSNVATGPLYSTDHALKPGQTGIYVYAKDQSYRYIVGGPKVYLDGQLLGMLPNNGYFYSQLSPGVHTLAVKYSKSFLTVQTVDQTFELNARQIKYFRVQFEESGGMTMLSGPTFIADYHWTIQAVPPQFGSKEIINLPLSTN